ncbi:hypothetical protein A6A12_0637 [Vibrio anguillarum]|nr:hypothetical protein A6A12_0637 [Vibrio anguillarum]
MLPFWAKGGGMDSFALFIPFPLEAAAVLATFAHPNQIVYLCSWG